MAMAVMALGAMAMVVSGMAVGMGVVSRYTQLGRHSYLLRFRLGRIRICCPRIGRKVVVWE
jgi:hypothetical protein